MPSPYLTMRSFGWEHRGNLEFFLTKIAAQKSRKSCRKSVVLFFKTMTMSTPMSLSLEVNLFGWGGRIVSLPQSLYPTFFKCNFSV